ncbi:MAG: MFS transporter [Chitinophagaceae bacterium]|nr:MFS transporter [Chitinophagaceae bacterium]
MTKTNYGVLSVPVVVAALGYFVDIYDLLLFTIVRVPSLQALGVAQAGMLDASTTIINWQMIGLLIGGIGWGIMGDKRGRLSVLFGSILLYSVANFLTGYVTNVTQYGVARFVAGVGLAGELGAGIALVSELLPKNKRGVGTSLVAGIGLFGAVFAYFTFRFTEDWRLCYKIGGALGIVLLFLRISVAESGMFKNVRSDVSVSKGNFFKFFNNGERFRKYLFAILIGLPTWYVIGILVNLSNMFATGLYGENSVDSGRAVMFSYIGIAIGDILIGLVSQLFKSRKKALFLFYGLTVISIVLFFSPINNNDTAMYIICTALGFSTGFWAIFVTMGAEQFGTNLRATAATTIPNMVRGSLYGLNFLFKSFFQDQLHWSIVRAGIVTGIIAVGIAVYAAYRTKETFHKDLNYVEM